jgi:hypothetical protein
MVNFRKLNPALINSVPFDKYKHIKERKTQYADPSKI